MLINKPVYYAGKDLHFTIVHQKLRYPRLLFHFFYFISRCLDCLRGVLCLPVPPPHNVVFPTVLFIPFCEVMNKRVRTSTSSERNDLNMHYKSDGEVCELFPFELRSEMPHIPKGASYFRIARPLRFRVSHSTGFLDANRRRIRLSLPCTPQLDSVWISAPTNAMPIGKGSR